MQARLFHLQALSALHCGTGQSVGVVDLPIARARATRLPLVPGSSIRGVLREDLTPKRDGDGRDAELVADLFGPKAIVENEKAFAGALAIGDAHLLCLPVRALAGVLCYVTSPFILARYAHDLGMAGCGVPAGLPTPASDSDALVAEGSANLMGSTLVLEDLDLAAGQNADTTAWAKLIAGQVYAADSTARADLIARFAIVPDNVLSYLSETATELRARIAIDDRTGVVRKGALWYEENLPAESILWGVYALAGSMNTESKNKRTAEELARLLPADGRLLQLGGKAGVGRGLVRLYI